MTSPSLDGLLQREFNRLLEWQSTTLLPGAVESGVIAESRARVPNFRIGPRQFVRRS